MKIVKWVIIPAIWIGIVCGVFVYIDWLSKPNINRDADYPVLPVKSNANTVTIASSNCCADSDNVTVSVKSSNGDITKIAECKHLDYHDIFEYPIPDITGFPVALIVESDFFDGENHKFSQVVKENIDLYRLKDNGVLIRLESDGADVVILSGKKHIEYMRTDRDNWEISTWPLQLAP